MFTNSSSQAAPDQLTVICASCNESISFVHGQANCTACGNPLYRNDSNHQCIACGMEFQPSESPLCPSCSLHYQEMFCMTCGETFSISPQDDSERMHVCTHCGKTSFRPFYPGGSTQYPSPFGSFGTQYPLTDYPTDYETTDYPFEEKTYPMICSLPLTSETLYPISSSLKEYEFDLSDFLKDREAPSLKIRALSLFCDTSSLPAGAQLRATVRDRRSYLIQQAIAIPERKARDKCLFKFEELDVLYTPDFSLSLEIIKNGERLKMDLPLHGSILSPMAIWKQKDNYDFTPALTLYGYMVNRNTGEQEMFPTSYPEPDFPDYIDFTYAPENIWFNNVQGDDIERRLVSDICVPIALPADGGARIDLIDFAVDTRLLANSGVRVSLGGGESIYATVYRMSEYFCRVDFDREGIEESRRMAKSSNIYIGFSNTGLLYAYYNKHTGEILGVVNGEIMMPTTEYPTSEYPTSEYPMAEYQTTDYPEHPDMSSLLDFTTMEETIWSNMAQINSVILVDEIEMRNVSEVNIPLVVSPGEEVQIDLIDFSVDAYVLGTPYAEISLGGGETFTVMTANMQNSFLRVELGMIPENRRVAKASGIKIRIPGKSTFCARYNKSNGEILGVVNGKLKKSLLNNRAANSVVLAGMDDPLPGARDLANENDSVTLYSSLAKGLESVVAFRNVAPLEYAVPALPTGYVTPTTAYAAANPLSEQPDDGDTGSGFHCPTTGYPQAGGAGNQQGQAGVNPDVGGGSEESQLPSGQILMSAPLLYKKMSSPAWLKYQHVTQRRIAGFNSPTGNMLDARQICLMTESRFPRFTDFTQEPEGQRADRSLTKSEQLRKVTIGEGDDSGLMPQTCFEEILENGTCIRYSAVTGTLIAIRALNGPWLTAQDWEKEVRVIYVDANNPLLPAEPPSVAASIDQATSVPSGVLRQVWSKQDGLVDITVQSEVQYTISWYAPEHILGYDESRKLYLLKQNAVAVKSWKVESSFLDFYIGDDDSLLEVGTDRVLVADDFNYLKSLKVTEKRGDMQFVSRWEHVDSSTLISTQGEGDSAEIAMTRRVATDPATLAELSQEYDFLDKTFMRVGDVLTREMDVIDTVPGIEGGSRARYRRYPFGDVCIEREEGYGTALSQTTRYIYDLDSPSRTYGCCLQEQYANGKVIYFGYDARKRMIYQKEPWAGGGFKLTRFTYDLDPQREGIVTSETESILMDGVEKEISTTRYSRKETASLIEERTTRLGIMAPLDDNNRPVAQVMVRQMYGIDPLLNGQTCVHAAGRYKMIRDVAGIQYDFVYQDSTEPGISFVGIVTRTAAGVIQPGLSTRIMHFYDANGQEVKMSRWVHTGGEFTRVEEETYTRDASHHIIRTDYLNGKFKTATWLCMGVVEETDINGITTVRQYNSAKRLVREIRSAPVFSPKTAESGQAFLLPSVITEYFYDVAGRETERRVTMGETVLSTFTAWDALNREARSTEEDGTVTEMSYSSNGLQVTRLTPGGAAFVSNYHPDGSILSESGTGQEAVFYSYGMTDCELVEYVNRGSSIGPLIREMVTGGFGQTIYSRELAGVGKPGALLHQYDGAGREILVQKENKPPVVNEYDAMGYRIRQTRQMPNSELNHVEENRVSHVIETFDFDFLPSPKPQWAGQPLAWSKRVYSRYVGTGRERVTESHWELLSTHLDSVGNVCINQDKLGVISVSWEENRQGTIYSYEIREGQQNCAYRVSLDGWQACAVTASGVETAYVYQYLSSGECVTTIDSRGNSVITQYNKAHRPLYVRDAAGNIITHEYDPVTGLLVKSTSPDGATVRQEYDYRGRVVARFGTGTAPVCYEYDEADRMTAMTTFRVPGQTLSISPLGRTDGDKTVMRYNDAGLLSQKIYPDGKSDSFSYNEEGQLMILMQSRGIMTAYRYDALTGKLVSVRHDDGTPGVTYEYDAWGNIVSVCDSSGMTTFSYTDKRELEEELHSGIYSTGLRRYNNELGLYDGYDLLLDGQLYEQNSLQYDSGLRLCGLVCNREGRSRRYGFSWKEDSGLADTVSFPNGIMKTFNYESRRNLVTGIRYGKSGSATSPVDEFTLSYDVAGRIVNKYGKAYNRSHEYAYNQRSEVISDQRSGNGRLTWDYDNAGNRIVAGTESADWNYKTNALNQYTSIAATHYPDSYSITPEYDEEGNQLSINTSTGDWRVVWDAGNRPVTFLQGNRRVECFYDSLGRRMRKKVLVGGVPVSHRCYLYDGYRLVAEMDALDSETQPVLMRTWVWDPTMGESASPLELMVWKSESDSPGESQPTTEYPEATSEYPEPPEPEGEREIVNHPVEFNQGICIGGGTIYVDGVKEINFKGTRISYSGNAANDKWPQIDHNEVVTKSQVEGRLAGVAPLDAREYRHMGNFGQIKDKYLPKGAWSLSLVYYEDGLYLDQLIKPGAKGDIVFFRGMATVCDVGTVYALRSPDSWMDSAGQRQTRASFVELNLVAVRGVSFKWGDMIALPEDGYVNLYCREINNPNGPQVIA